MAGVASSDVACGDHHHLFLVTIDTIGEASVLAKL